MAKLVGAIKIEVAACGALDPIALLLHKSLLVEWLDDHNTVSFDDHDAIELQAELARRVCAYRSYGLFALHGLVVSVHHVECMAHRGEAHERDEDDDRICKRQPRYAELFHSGI